LAGAGGETVGVQAGPHGIPVGDHLRAGERLWAIGDVNGIWPLTHLGEYERDVVAANIAGRPCPANYEAVPRIYDTALMALRMNIANMPPPADPMDAQMANVPGASA
jgi:pyruvate/2-oxoglutarate dehydrogenase complex dihydrolipoamide dehydrogenase (E3) component